MTTAASYMRCSGESQVDGDTWERQSETIKACCKLQDLELIHEYREEGVSGKLDEDSRPAFQAMVADLLGNGCRTIVVERLQRLARRLRIQEQLVIYLASKGLTLIAADTGEDITAALKGDPMKWALVQMQAVFGELDAKMTVEKLAKARRRIREQGRRPGAKNYSPDPVRNRRSDGQLPYGWKPGEEGTLKRIHILAASGSKPREIADTLNADGIFSRYGKPWQTGTIGNILRRNQNFKNLRQ